LLSLLTDEGRAILKVDELRRAIEDLGSAAYDELTYYERWIAAMSQLLLEKGVIDVDSLGRRMEEIRQRHQGVGESDSPG